MLLVLLLLDEAEALVPAVLLREFLEGCPVEKETLGGWGCAKPPPGSWTHTKNQGIWEGLTGTGWKMALGTWSSLQ